MKIIRVGRSSANDIVIQNDNYVGRAHCQFVQDDSGGYRIIDLNSTNGTFINGVRCYGETRLQPNDIVRIGNTMLPWQTYFSGGNDSTAVHGRTESTAVNGESTHTYSNPSYTPHTDQPTPIIAEKQKGCGFGIAALVCGIIGINLLAIIFGAVALARNEKNQGLGIAGLVLGIIWTIIGILIVFSY